MLVREFFSLSSFFLLFLSINVATGMSHVTCRLKQNASTAAENFDKQALWAFHFAVIYGLAILQIRHLSELYISNWRLSPRACRTRPRRLTRKSLSIGRKRKNDGRGNGELPVFEGANQSPRILFSFSNRSTIGNIRSTSIRGWFMNRATATSNTGREHSPPVVEIVFVVSFRSSQFNFATFAQAI